MSHFSVERYIIGLEDGFIAKTNKLRHVPTPSCCDVTLIPFIYDANGIKQHIHDGDYIALVNGLKIIININYDKTNTKNRNRKTGVYV